MTVLALSRLWVNLAATGEAVSGASGRGKTQTFSKEGNVRTYASGRRRSIGIAGESGELGFTLVALDLTAKERLRTWIKQTVLVRDNRGQKWWGDYRSISVSEYLRTDLYAVTFTLDTITYTEGI